VPGARRNSDTDEIKGAARDIMTRLGLLGSLQFRSALPIGIEAMSTVCDRNLPAIELRGAPVFFSRGSRQVWRTDVDAPRLTPNE
jgi:hypothetical protein